MTVWMDDQGLTVNNNDRIAATNGTTVDVQTWDKVSLIELLGIWVILLERSRIVSRTLLWPQWVTLSHQGLTQQLSQ